MVVMCAVAAGVAKGEYSVAIARDMRPVVSRGVRLAFAGQPRLKNAAYYLKRPSLNYTTADRLAAAHADVNDALKSEREAIGGVFIPCLG